MTFILHEYPIILPMKTALIDLLNIINYHINYIELDYPPVKDIIFQMNELIKYNASDREIVEWMLFNHDSIKIINECIENGIDLPADPEFIK